MAQQHAERLGARGHEVVVVTTRLDDELLTEEREGYRIVRYNGYNPLESVGLPYPLPKPDDALDRFREALNDADIAHFHGLNYLTTAAGAWALPDDVPMVLHQHTPHIQYRLPVRLVESLNDLLVGQWNLKNADLVVAVSETIEEFVHNFGVTPNGAVETLYNGIDLDRYSPNNRVAPGKLNWRSDCPSLLCVSRLSYKKGVDTLIEAARILRTQGIIFDLTIVGSGTDETDLRERAQGMDNVSFAGFVSDETLEQYYATADGFVFPSRTGEAFPTLTMMEALASGTPVIATEINNPPVSLTNGSCEFVPPDDPEALATQLEEFLSSTTDAERMQRLARETAVESFDIEKKIDRIERLYYTL